MPVTKEPESKEPTSNEIKVEKITWISSDTNFVIDTDQAETKDYHDETESQMGYEEALRRGRRLTHLNYDDTMTKQDDLSTDNEDESQLEMPVTPIKFVIIDCSPINFIDTTGVKTLKQVF